MASNINSVTVSGNIARDPELRYTPSGDPITDFTIACNRAVKRGDAWEDEAEFYKVTVFGNQAEPTSKYLKKGDKVTVLGRISYQAVGEGDARKWYFKIIANQIEWPKKAASADDEDSTVRSTPARARPAPSRQSILQAAVFDDDLPF